MALRQRHPDRLLDILLAAVLCTGLLTAACTDSRQHAQLADSSVADVEAASEAVSTSPPEPVAVPSSRPGPRPVFRPDEELLIFELRWRDVVLNEAIIGYLDGARVLLPLGETLQSLDFPISVDLGAGFARGWFLEPNRLFHLDIERQEVIVEGQRQKVPPNMVELHRDDIFVDSRMLAEWFPIDLQVDIAGLQIQVIGREPLPIAEREARAERRQDIFSRQDGERDGYMQMEMPPYRALSWPNIDLSTEQLYRKDKNGSDEFVSSFNVFATGDLLYLDSEIFIGGDDEHPLSDARLSAGRKDPDGGLAGPLGVTEYAVGDIFTPQVPLISRQQVGRGAEISSFPLLRPTEFDRITLRGDLPLGWEVELYRNEVLLNFQLARSDGLYEFVDVPLVYGLNVLRLVFYGPQGQKREELKRLLVGAGLVRPGNLHFRFAGNQHDQVILPVNDGTDPEPQEGDTRGFAEFELGITRNLSLAAGLSSVPLETERRSYGSLGLRAGVGNVFARLDVIGDDTGGRAGKVALQSQFSNHSLLLEHSEFSEFVSEQVSNDDDLLERRSNARLDGLLGLPFLPSIPYAFTGAYERRGSGSDSIDVTNRLSTNINGLSMSNNLNWHWDNINDSDTNTLIGGFLVGGRFGPVDLRGGVDYGIEPDQEITRASVTGDWAINRNFGARLSYQRLEIENRNVVSAGVNRRFDNFSLGLDLEASDDGSFLTRLSLSSGFGREPRNGELRVPGRGMAGQAAVSPRVFLDRNQSGQFDEGDEPLEGVRFKVNGANAEQQTGADGTAFLTHLRPYQHLDLGLDSGSLEDPYWTAPQSGVSVVLRPGTAVTAEFPIVTTGEIDGTASLWRDGAFEPVSEVRMQLLDEQGELVKEVETAYDGFYLFDFVTPGRYTLRVDPNQMARLQLEAPLARYVVVADGEILNGMDFEINAPGTGTEPWDQRAARPTAEPDRAAPGTEAPVGEWIEPVGPEPDDTGTDGLPPLGDKSEARTSIWTGYQVQVGAYRTRARAERAWAVVLRSAQGLLDGLSHEVIEADLGDGHDIVYRLRAGPLSGPTAARTLCFQLRARGTGCFVVPPLQDGAARTQIEAPGVETPVPSSAGSPAPQGPTGSTNPATHAGHQLQLGAYRTAAQADRAWASITGATSGLLDGLSRQVTEADLGLGRGFGYRLRAGPLPDRAAGNRLCAELKARGIGCFPVPPLAEPTPAPEPPAEAKAAEAPDVAQEPPPHATAPSRQGYQVQLGAFRSMARARRAWQEIMSAANSLLDELSREVIEVDLGGDKGVFFRLRAGPLPDRSTAKRLCVELEASGIGCFVARPSNAVTKTHSNPQRAALGDRPGAGHGAREAVDPVVQQITQIGRAPVRPAEGDAGDTTKPPRGDLVQVRPAHPACLEGRLDLGEACLLGILQD